MVLKFKDVEAKRLRKLTFELCAARKAERDAKKKSEAAREVFRRVLSDLRGVDVDYLAEGEFVIVQLEGGDGLKIDRRGADRFDLEKFRVEQPKLAESFTKRTVATYFEPLID